MSTKVINNVASISVAIFDNSMDVEFAGSIHENTDKNERNLSDIRYGQNISIL